MFFKEKKEISKAGGEGDDDIPQNVTDVQTDADSVDLEANSSYNSLSPIPKDGVVPVVLTANEEQVVDKAIEAGCSSSADQPQSNRSGADAALPLLESVTRDRHQLPLQVASSEKLDADLLLPALEESKDEEEKALAPPLFLSPNFVSSVSFRKDESDDVDDEEENLCAICLSEYSKCLLL